MRPIVGATAALLLLVGCTTASGPPLTITSGPTTSEDGSTTDPSPSGPISPKPAGEFDLPPPSPGKESAAAVRTRLCVRPPVPQSSPAATEAAPPPAIVETEHEVEQVRGLDFEHPVAVDAVTHEQLVQGLNQSFDHSYPADMLGRRSRVWSTIGVIPPGTSLQDAYRKFLSGQVIGYYDPSTGQLVFIGTDNPSPVERFTLAHELTHADDDQHFDLARMNDLENACDDERLEAATGAVEGSAVYFSQQVVEQFFSASDLAKLALGGDGGGLPAGVPRFVEQLEIWPYLKGPNFISGLRANGGLDEVNQALKDIPASTEQILHPDKFPNDKPIKVDVPDLGQGLGPGWKDLDVMDTGEEWLKELFELKLDGQQSATGADGWGGAQYRAWTDGTHVAVVLDTTWDTPADASQFLGAMQQWQSDRDDATVGPVKGDDKGVVALFASDAATLQQLEAALGR